MLATFTARNLTFCVGHRNRSWIMSSNTLGILFLTAFLFQKVHPDTVIEFVGNEEASDGITYWAYEIPNVTVSITSKCSSNGTHHFSVSNETQTFYNSLISTDERCQSCVCTTINSTTSVSTECLAENEEFIFGATIYGLSSETTNFTVEFTNSTSVLAKSSAFRNEICESSETSVPSTVIPEVGNTTAGGAIDSGAVTESLVTSTQSQAVSANGQTTKPIAVQSQPNGQNSSSDTNMMITTASALTNDGNTQDGANETQNSKVATATPAGLQSTDVEDDVSITPSSSPNENTSQDDVTTSSINATDNENVTTSSSNNIDRQTQQIIAVCVATNVIMVLSCCVMIAFFRHKRSDERKSRSRRQKI